MTKCLWVDPVYENLDDISKMMLPYLATSDAQDFVNSVSTVEITSEEIVRNMFYRSYSSWIDLRGMVEAKLSKYGDEFSDKKIKRELEIEPMNIPESLVLDLVTGKMDADSITFKINLKDVKQKIEEEKSNLFDIRRAKKFTKLLTSEMRASERKRLKFIMGIFVKEKSRLMDLDKLGDQVGLYARSWLKKQDIRAIDFVWRFEKEVIKAIEGDKTALTWLKVLKARSLENEPMYSMELR